MLLRRQSLVTVDIFYFMPQSKLIQEFLWQVDDYVPDIPRVHKFLLFWKDNIDAIIRDVLISDAYSGYRYATFYGDLN